MARRVGITVADVIAAAVAIADEHGDAVAATPTAVAGRLRVRTPSLYAHVDGASGLRRLVAHEAHTALTAALRDAVASTDEPAAQLRAVCHAYRRFALQRPGLYDALLPAPTEAEDPAGAALALEAVETIASALGGFELGTDRPIDTIRWMRSLLHGFVDLELRRGFGLDAPVADSFDFAVDALIAAITGMRNPGNAQGGAGR